MKNINLHNKSIRLMVLTAMSLVIISCDDFLEEPPSTSTNLEIKTTEQLDILLNNYNVFSNENNNTVIFSSDDYELPVNLFNARPSAFDLSSIQYYTWDIDNVILRTDNFWNGEYRKIFYANTVLDNLNNVSGSADDKERLDKEAHFVRAYSYFELVNTFCLPYSQSNLGALGLPIKTLPNYEEPLGRNSLQETYNFIEEDIKKSLQLNVNIVQSGQLRTWRANTAAVNALAARFYLAKQDYDKAMEYANNAIQNHPGLADYNTDMYFGNSESYVLDSGTPQQQSYTVEYPYTHDNQSDPTDRLNWKEFIYYRLLNNPGWWYIPSNALLNLYDKDYDLRYKFHVVEGYSYSRGLTKPSYEYPGYIFFFKSDLPNGPTIGEMYLIKAECQARLGNFSEAINTANALYVKRTVSGAPLLSASSKDEAIKVILEERRRELPFTQRWFDIRRYNSNDTTIDDVELSRVFYPYNTTSILSTDPVQTYTLSKDSNRYATPIPDNEITASQGILKQNPY